MNPHLLWLSIDNPAPPYHRIVRDIKQPFGCPTRIDTGFILSSSGIVYFGDRRRIGILSLLGVERVRALLEETIRDTLGNDVAVCLCPFDCVAVMVEVCLEICARGSEVRIRGRLG